MPEINHIKKLRNIKSLPINEISKRTVFCWETVKKYADGDQMPVKKIPVKKGMMSEEKWGELLGDQGITTAILNRLLHRSEVLHLDGDSHRIKYQQT